MRYYIIKYTRPYSVFSKKDAVINLFMNYSMIEEVELKFRFELSLEDIKFILFKHLEKRRTI